MSGVMTATLRRNELTKISKPRVRTLEKKPNSTRDAYSKTLIKNSENANSFWRKHFERK